MQRCLCFRAVACQLHNACCAMLRSRALPAPLAPTPCPHPPQRLRHFCASHARTRQTSFRRASFCTKLSQVGCGEAGPLALLSVPPTYHTPFCCAMCSCSSVRENLLSARALCVPWCSFHAASWSGIGPIRRLRGTCARQPVSHRPALTACGAAAAGEVPVRGCLRELQAPRECPREVVDIIAACMQVGGPLLV